MEVVVGVGESVEWVDEVRLGEGVEVAPTDCDTVIDTLGVGVMDSVGVDEGVALGVVVEVGVGVGVALGLRNWVGGILSSQYACFAE